MPENNDFFYDSSIKKNFYKREIWFRISGILFIGLLFPAISYNSLSDESGFFYIFIVSIVRTALIWHGSMLIVNYAVNRFSIFKEPVKLLSFQVAALIIYVILIEIGEIWAIENLFHYPLSSSKKREFIVYSLLITLTINSIYASVSFFMQWKSNMEKARALEKATLEARYEVLRNQINPHFLFNSLNTLLMLVGDNLTAARYVESVSEFMRYLLNSRGKDSVLLSEELKMAIDYTFIQQIRYGEKLRVNFNIPEMAYDKLIPPLALQMLIENALKHNVISREQPLIINVYVDPSNYLIIENPIKPKLDKEESTGLGLINIRNRYLFLTGKEIVVTTVNDIFKVMLPLFFKEI